MSATVLCQRCGTNDGGQVTTDDTTGGTVIVLHGDIDACTGRQLQVLRAEAAATGHPVTVDVTAVSFMDCTGVSFLITLTKDIAPRRVTVLRPTPQVASLLAITQLARILDSVID